MFSTGMACFLLELHVSYCYDMFSAEVNVHVHRKSHWFTWTEDENEILWPLNPIHVEV